MSRQTLCDRCGDSIISDEYVANMKVECWGNVPLDVCGTCLESLSTWFNDGSPSFKAKANEVEHWKRLKGVPKDTPRKDKNCDECVHKKLADLVNTYFSGDVEG